MQKIPPLGVDPQDPRSKTLCLPLHVAGAFCMSCWRLGMKKLGLLQFPVCLRCVDVNNPLKVELFSSLFFSPTLLFSCLIILLCSHFDSQLLLESGAFRQCWIWQAAVSFSHEFFQLKLSCLPLSLAAVVLLTHPLIPAWFKMALRVYLMQDAENVCALWQHRGTETKCGEYS